MNIAGTDPERLRQLASEVYRVFLETERKKVRERMEHSGLWKGIGLRKA